MPNLTYNLIVTECFSGFNYWSKIQRLAASYGIRGRFILSTNHRVMLADLTEGNLDARVIEARPYDELRRLVREEYEPAITETDTPRWIIAPKRDASRIRGKFTNFGVMKGFQYFTIELNFVYPPKSLLRTHGAITAYETKPEAVVEDTQGMVFGRSPQGIANAQTIANRPSDSPDLAELIRRYVKNHQS